MCMMFEKIGNTPKSHKSLNKNQTIWFSVSETLTVKVLRPYLQKRGISYFLLEE